MAKKAPDKLAEREEPEEIGATKGEATGVWRVLLISTAVAVAAMAAIGAFYL